METRVRIELVFFREQDGTISARGRAFGEDGALVADEHARFYIDQMRGIVDVARGTSNEQAVRCVPLSTLAGGLAAKVLEAVAPDAPSRWDFPSFEETKPDIHLVNDDGR